MINIFGAGCRQKIFFFQKFHKNPKIQKKKKKIFDVTMLLILVNYSSSNLKSFYFLAFQTFISVCTIWHIYIYRLVIFIFDQYCKNVMTQEKN
jgi:hypothetical protein